MERILLLLDNYLNCFIPNPTQSSELACTEPSRSVNIPTEASLFATTKQNDAAHRAFAAAASSTIYAIALRTPRPRSPSVGAPLS
jgi:hypothetical protein